MIKHHYLSYLALLLLNYPHLFAQQQQYQDSYIDSIMSIPAELTHMISACQATVDLSVKKQVIMWQSYLTDEEKDEQRVNLQEPPQQRQAPSNYEQAVMRSIPYLSNRYLNLNEAGSSSHDSSPKKPQYHDDREEEVSTLPPSEPNVVKNHASIATQTNKREIIVKYTGYLPLNGVMPTNKAAIRELFFDEHNEFRQPNPPDSRSGVGDDSRLVFVAFTANSVESPEKESPEKMNIWRPYLTDGEQGATLQELPRHHIDPTNSDLWIMNVISYPSLNKDRAPSSSNAVVSSSSSHVPRPKKARYHDDNAEQTSTLPPSEPNVVENHASVTTQTDKRKIIVIYTGYLPSYGVNPSSQAALRELIMDNNDELQQPHTSMDRRSRVDSRSDLAFIAYIAHRIKSVDQHATDSSDTLNKESDPNL